jgi:hypothetical protein
VEVGGAVNECWRVLECWRARLWNYHKASPGRTKLPRMNNYYYTKTSAKGLSSAGFCRTHANILANVPANISANLRPSRTEFDMAAIQPDSDHRCAYCLAEQVAGRIVSPRPPETIIGATEVCSAHAAEALRVWSNFLIFAE